MTPANGFDRREFLRRSGLAAASAAVLAGCGSGGGPGALLKSTTTPTTVEGGAPSSADIVILRTASSVERLAVDVYTSAFDSGLAKSAALADTLRLFRDHHREHADLFERTTKKLGGEPFAKANPVVMATLDPAVKGLRDEKGVAQLAYDLETMAAATYLAVVGAFNDRTLNKTSMGVGSVEARHAAVLANLLSTTFGTRTDAVPPDGVLKRDKAVAAGTGVK